jgi:hypothetical protein
MAKIPRYKISRDEKIRFQDALVKALTRKDDMGISNLQKVADSLVRNAMLGKEASIAMIADRLDGKVGGDFGGDSPVTFQAIQIRAVWPTLNGSIEGKMIDAKQIDIDGDETIN